MRFRTRKISRKQGIDSVVREQMNSWGPMRGENPVLEEEGASLKSRRRCEVLRKEFQKAGRSWSRPQRGQANKMRTEKVW